MRKWNFPISCSLFKSLSYFFKRLQYFQRVNLAHLAPTCSPCPSQETPSQCRVSVIQLSQCQVLNIILLPHHILRSTISSLHRAKPQLLWLILLASPSLFVQLDNQLLRSTRVLYTLDLSSSSLHTPAQKVHTYMRNSACQRKIRGKLASAPISNFLPILFSQATIKKKPEMSQGKTGCYF